MAVSCFCYDGIARWLLADVVLTQHDMLRWVRLVFKDMLIKSVAAICGIFATMLKFLHIGIKSKEADCC